ncbi:MAG: ATP-binding protein, partial [Planctomycetota bacterium]
MRTERSTGALVLMASPRSSISPPRRLTWTYIGALTAIGVFVFAGERALQASLATEAETWNELAELEEERALANELIHTVILASRADVMPESQEMRETSVTELDELLRVWPVLVHRPTRTTAERRAAKKLHESAIRARSALQTPLQDAPRETQIAFLRELDDTARATLSDAALWHEALAASVNRIRSRIANDHERTSSLATLIAGILALTLLFEGWFLFRPISRKFALFLRRQHRLLDVTRGYEQRARDLAQTKESFLANVSHEIRTPLHGVLGMTDLLMRTDLDTRQGEYIETIQSCGRSLLHLVDDVLDLAKLEAGEMKLESIEFEPRALIEGVMEVASPTLKAGVDVFFVEDPSLPEKLIGDPERLRQILANLLNNACKFTLEGEIVVLARCLPGSQVEVGKAATATLLEIEVQDSGIGRPEGSTTRLFREFTHADASTPRKHGGTGLGLSICRQLCTAMGGEISAEARTSGGSLFRFTAQVRQSNIQSASPSPRFEALAGKHILCVDAHPLGRRLLREKLERTGA